MTFNIRSFAEILAERQGGIALKPGQPLVQELTKDEVKNIFGEIPAAVAAYGVVINVREIKPGIYRIVARLESVT